MREKLRKAGLPIAIVLLLAAAIIFYLSNQEPPAPDVPTSRQYFVDLESGEETVRSINEIPPLAGTTPDSVVRAVYYTCSTCEHRQLAYYEKFTPEAKKLQEEAIAAGREIPDDKRIEDGYLIRRGETGSPWVPISSTRGAEILDSIKCGNKPAMYCRPPKQ